jgi:hypothetical protein
MNILKESIIPTKRLITGIALLVSILSIIESCTKPFSNMYDTSGGGTGDNGGDRYFTGSFILL